VIFFGFYQESTEDGGYAAALLERENGDIVVYPADRIRFDPPTILSEVSE
jgi:hypothetical protein